MCYNGHELSPLELRWLDWIDEQNKIRDQKNQENGVTGLMSLLSYSICDACLFAHSGKEPPKAKD